MDWVVIWPFLVPVVIVMVVFAYLVAVRYMRHKEYMAMIEKGIPPHRDPGEHDPMSPPPGSAPSRNRLMGGMITAAVGLAITLGLLTLGIGPWLLMGLVPLFAGLAILFVHFLTGDGK